MIRNVDNELCMQLGLRDGQIRAPYPYKNLWWSFDHDRSFFGYGDLNDKDCQMIYEYLSKPENRGKVFTGWNEHHGSQWQQTDHAMVRISWAAGITRPHHIMLESRFT